MYWGTLSFSIDLMKKCIWRSEWKKSTNTRFDLRVEKSESMEEKEFQKLQYI